MLDCLFTRQSIAILGLGSLLQTTFVFGACEFKPGFTTQVVMLNVPAEVFIPVSGWDTGPWGFPVFSDALVGDSHVEFTCEGSYTQALGYAVPLVRNPIGTWPGWDIFHTNYPGISVMARERFWTDPVWAGVQSPPQTLEHSGVAPPYLGRNWIVSFGYSAAYVPGGILHLPNPLIVETYGGLTLVEVRFNRDSVIISSLKPTCSVSPDSLMIPVDLKSHTLTGIGSQSAPERLDIKLECVGGTHPEPLRVFVSLTDANHAGNTSHVLGLSPASTAAGAGIRITRDGNIPVQYGPPAPSSGAAHQWRAGSVRPGEREFTIPLQANFIQTEAVVTPGEVEAQAIFTIAYE